MRRRRREPAAIAAEIDRIRSLRLDALRRQWRLVFGRVPPAAVSKDLLGRMIAARLQERAFGGLDRDSLRFLQSLARHQRLPRRQLKPGTSFASIKAGATSSPPSATVSTGREPHIPAFRDRTRHHRHGWSGPRFFALQAAGDGSKPKRKSAAAPDDGRRQRRLPTAAMVRKP
jgi:hypothetical protein